MKILRTKIKKLFNEEIDAMMLFAFLIESVIKKTKRLKLVDVVFLLKEITNLEMDLRFEAAAANEYAENTKNDVFEGYLTSIIDKNFDNADEITKDLFKDNNIKSNQITTFLNRPEVLRV